MTASVDEVVDPTTLSRRRWTQQLCNGGRGTFKWPERGTSSDETRSVLTCGRRSSLRPIRQSSCLGNSRLSFSGRELLGMICLTSSHRLHLTSILFRAAEKATVMPLCSSRLEQNNKEKWHAPLIAFHTFTLYRVFLEKGHPQMPRPLRKGDSDSAGSKVNRHTTPGGNFDGALLSRNRAR